MKMGVGVQKNIFKALSTVANIKYKYFTPAVIRIITCKITNLKATDSINSLSDNQTNPSISFLTVLDHK